MEEYNIPTIKDRDAELEDLWEQFGDVPMDPGTEKMEESFLHFPAGTDRQEIWEWFDARYSNGVYYLLYRNVENIPNLIGSWGRYHLLYKECNHEYCAYNKDRECRFAFVHERAPVIFDDGWCSDCAPDREMWLDYES